SQPFREQIPRFLREAGLAVQALRRLVVTANLKAQSLNAFLPAQVLGKSHHCFSQAVSAKSFAQIELVEQSEPPMEFQAKAKRQDEISGQFRAAIDEADLSQRRIGDQCLDGGAGYVFVESHVLLGIELAHQPEKRRYLVLGNLLEEGVRHFCVF